MATIRSAQTGPKTSPFIGMRPHVTVQMRGGQQESPASAAENMLPDHVERRILDAAPAERG